MMTSTDKQETMHANRKRHYPAESAPMDQLFSRGQSRVYKRGIQRRLSIVEPCRFSLSRFSTQGPSCLHMSGPTSIPRPNS